VNGQPLAWAEVDLAAIAHNLAALCALLPAGSRLAAVVKADGYGHGAAAVGRAALAAGAGALAVARLPEALTLRAAGIGAPILVLGHTPADGTEAALDADLIQSVVSLESAAAHSRQALRSGRRLRVHLKLDSGMGRLGLPLEAAGGGALADALAVARLPGLRLEGVFTHLATADAPDTGAAEAQLALFEGFLARLAAAGVRPALRHAANSAALLRLPAARLDWVRPGISLYGLDACPDAAALATLRPAMSLKARVIQVKPVAAGQGISYGLTWRAPRDTVIATVALGYADGLRRGLSSRGAMLVRGRRAAIAGRVCMDLTMLDVGHIPGVRPGDEAVAFGSQGGESIRVEELAAALGTINYEIVTGVTARVPRLYRNAPA
jgi:alanine racemase